VKAEPQYASAEAEEAAHGFISLKLAGPKVNSRLGLTEFLAMHCKDVSSGGGRGATGAAVRDASGAQQGGAPAAAEERRDNGAAAAGPGVATVEAEPASGVRSANGADRRGGGAGGDSERSNCSERGAEQLSELKAARAAAKPGVEKLARGEQLDAAEQAAVQALAEVAEIAEVTGSYYYTRSSADALALGYAEEMKMQALQERATRSGGDTAAGEDPMSAEELDRMLAHQAAIVHRRKVQAMLRVNPPTRPSLNVKRRNTEPIPREEVLLVARQQPSMKYVPATPSQAVEDAKAGSSISLGELVTRSAEARQAQAENFNRRVAATDQKQKREAGVSEAPGPVSELESIKSELKMPHERLNEAWSTAPPPVARARSGPQPVVTVGHFSLGGTESKVLTPNEREAARARLEDIKAGLKTFAAQDLASCSTRSAEARRRQANEPSGADGQAARELAAMKAQLTTSQKAFNIRSPQSSTSSKHEQSPPVEPAGVSAAVSPAPQSSATPAASRGSSGMRRKVSFSHEVTIVAASTASEAEKPTAAAGGAAAVEVSALAAIEAGAAAAEAKMAAEADRGEALVEVSAVAAVQAGAVAAKTAMPAEADGGAAAPEARAAAAVQAEATIAMEAEAALALVAGAADAVAAGAAVSAEAEVAAAVDNQTTVAVEREATAAVEAGSTTAVEVGAAATIEARTAAAGEAASMAVVEAGATLAIETGSMAVVQAGSTAAVEAESVAGGEAAAAVAVEVEAEGVSFNGEKKEKTDKKDKKEKKERKEKRSSNLSKEERRELKRVKAELRESAEALTGAKVVLKPHRPRSLLVWVEDIFAQHAGKVSLTGSKRAELRAIQADLQAAAAEFDTKAALFSAIARRAQAGSAGGRGGSRMPRRKSKLEAVKEELRASAAVLAGKPFHLRKRAHAVSDSALPPPLRALSNYKAMSRSFQGLKQTVPWVSIAPAWSAVAAMLTVLSESSPSSEGSPAATRPRVRLHLRACPPPPANAEHSVTLTAAEREELEALKAELRASAVAMAGNAKSSGVVFASKDAARQKAKLELKRQREAEREAKKKAERERRRTLKLNLKDRTAKGERKAAVSGEGAQEGAASMLAPRRRRRGTKTDFELIKAELRAAAAALEGASVVLGRRMMMPREEPEAEILPPGASLIKPTLSYGERAMARLEMEEVKAELRASAAQLLARGARSGSNLVQSLVGGGAPPEVEAARSAAKMAMSRLAAGLRLTDDDGAAVMALVTVLAQAEAGGMSSGARSMTDQIARRWVEREEIQALQEKARRGETLDVEEVDRMLAEQERRTREREAAASKGGGAAEERLEEHARRKLSMTVPAPRRGNAGRPNLVRRVEGATPMGGPMNAGPMAAGPTGNGATGPTGMPSGRSPSARRGSAPAVVVALIEDTPTVPGKMTLADLQAAKTRSADAFLKATGPADENEEEEEEWQRGLKSAQGKATTPRGKAGPEAAASNARQSKIIAAWRSLAVAVNKSLHPIDNVAMRAAIKGQLPAGSSPRRKQRYEAFEKNLMPVMEAAAEEAEGRDTEAEWLKIRSTTAATVLHEVANWLGLVPGAADKLASLTQHNAASQLEALASGYKARREERQRRLEENSPASPSLPRERSSEASPVVSPSTPSPNDSSDQGSAQKESAREEESALTVAPAVGRSPSHPKSTARGTDRHVMCEAHTQTESGGENDAATLEAARATEAAVEQRRLAEAAELAAERRRQAEAAEATAERQRLAEAAEAAAERRRIAEAAEMAAERRRQAEATEAAAERRRLAEAAELARERQQLAEEREQHAAEQREMLEQAAARLERERERLAAAREEKLAEEAALREARMVEEAAAREARLVEQAARRAEEARLHEAENARLVELEERRASEREEERARLAAVEARQEEEACARDAAAREWELERHEHEEERIRLAGENETLRHAIAKRQLEEENEVLRRELEDAKEAGQEAIAELARQLASSPEPVRAVAAGAGGPWVGDHARLGLLPSIGRMGMFPGAMADRWHTEYPGLRPQNANPGARLSHASLVRAALDTAEAPRSSCPAILYAEPAWRIGSAMPRLVPRPESGGDGVNLRSKPYETFGGAHGAYDPSTLGGAAWAQVYGPPAEVRPIAPRSARSTRPARLASTQPLSARQRSTSDMRPHRDGDAEYRRGSFQPAKTHPQRSSHTSSSLYLLDESRGAKLVPLSPSKAEELDVADDARDANSPPPALREPIPAWRSLVATPPSPPREGGAGRAGLSPRTKRGLPASGELHPARSRSSLLRTYGIV
jgi:hypothetical protein